MLQSHSDQVYIYNSHTQNNVLLQQIADLHTFTAFSTDNIYQLQQYYHALPPKVMIFNIYDSQSLADLKSTLANPPQKIPLIVVRDSSLEIQPHPAIAHYLYSHEHPTLLDIVESYCMGGKKHDVMLLSSYSAQIYPLKKLLLNNNYQLFEVHNAEAARLYLNKNKPHIVCVEYTPQFITSRHILHHPHIFYVDRQQDIAEIKKFLH